MTADAGFWDRQAESYAAKPLDNPEAYQRKLDVIREHLEPHDVLLDVGCGTGSLVLDLAGEVAHGHGVDLSPEMMRIAREKAEKQGADNVTFHVGADDALPDLEAGSLGAICAFNILHLVDDRAGLLRRLFALLEPGGVFVSSTPCLGGGWVPFRVILPVMRLFGMAPTVHVFDIATVRRDIEEAGFVEIMAPEVGAESRIAFLVAKKPSG